MSLLHAALDESGPLLLLASIALAAVLTLVAAALEITLERAGGPDPARTPDWFARNGPALFLFGGAPSLLLAMALTFGLTVALGGNPDHSSLSGVWPALLDLAVLASIICWGIGSPLTQHWGLGVAAFGAGVSATFPLLFVALQLPFAEDGSLPYPDRLIFALTVALIVATLTLAAAALIALAVTSVRTYQALRSARQATPVLWSVPRADADTARIGRPGNSAGF